MKKSLQYYQSLNYEMVIDYDYHEKYFVVLLPELPGCMADGTTIRKAINMALIVKNDWLETAYKEKWEIPLPKTLLDKLGKTIKH